MLFVSSNYGHSFKLTSRHMIETGRFWKRYSAKRRDIRLMFLHLHLNNNEGTVGVRYFTGTIASSAKVEFIGAHLHIGCQNFNQYETQKLMSWAFEEPYI